jgi:hypothetical protein
MGRHLKKLFFLLGIIFIPAGFFTEHEHAVFFWHTIPSMDAIFGGLGALLLMLGVKMVGSFASRSEDFYD